MTHRLNNLLQLVAANLAIIRRVASDRPDIVERIESTSNALSEIMTIVTQRESRTESPASGRVERLRIVLAEDDALVRMSVAGVLEDVGHMVTQVGTGAEALDALASGADLLITDLNLPDANGLDLVRKARAANPSIAVVVASGNQQGEETHFVWVQKPFTSARLRGAVRAALEIR